MLGIANRFMMLMRQLVVIRERTMKLSTVSGPGTGAMMRVDSSRLVRNRTAAIVGSGLLCPHMAVVLVTVGVMIAMPRSMVSVFVLVAL